jgi:DNA-binding transcriptional LysR family regulator
VDVIKNGYDVVLRSAKLESSNLIARKVFSLNNIICASPDYLKKHKPIVLPEDLSHHQFAIYHLAKRNDELKLAKNKRSYKVSIRSNVTTNQLDLIKQMVLNGTCLGVLPEFMIKNEIAIKSIVPCLSNYELLPSPIYLIYPNKELLAPKVKAFITILKQYKLQDNEGLLGII